MTMKDFDQSKVDAPMEQLPTERYLKLIGHGFRFYNVDPDYIDDQIMSVPYTPARKPEDYETYGAISDRLPKLTFAKYQKLCQETSEIYFILHHKVLRLQSLDPSVRYDPNHPAVLWLKERAHGARDLAWVMHQTIVEPDLPLADSYEDLTPAHFAWAENDSLDFLRKNNLMAIQVFELVSGESNPKWRRRLAQFLPAGCASHRLLGSVVRSNDPRLRRSRGPSTSSELLQQEEEFRRLQSAAEDPDGHTDISTSSQ